MMRSTAHLVALDDTLLKLALTLERDAMTAQMSNLYDASPLLLQPGLSVAFVEDGYLLGAGGLAPVWNGLAEAWLLISILARPRHIVAGLRAAKRWLDAKQRDPAFTRVQLYVRADAPWRQSFVAALGVERDGALLKRWGRDGADYCLHARFAHGEMV